MLFQTGQDIEFLNILIDICPPLGVVALVLLGGWIVVKMATRRK